MHQVATASSSNYKTKTDTFERTLKKRKHGILRLHDYGNLLNSSDLCKIASYEMVREWRGDLPVRPAATGVTLMPDDVTMVGVTTLMPVAGRAGVPTVVTIFCSAAAAAASAAMPLI